MVRKFYGVCQEPMWRLTLLSQACMGSLTLRFMGLASVETLESGVPLGPGPRLLLNTCGSRF
jgi:hypothetical protein